MGKRFKSFNELKGYTSIDLTSKTIDDIFGTIDEYREANGECNINFPFKEGVIIRKQSSGEYKDVIKDVLSYYYFKIENEEQDNFKILVEIYQSSNIMGDNIFVGQCAMKFDIDNETSNSNVIIPLEYNEEECKGMLKQAIQTFRKSLTNKETLSREMGYVLSSLMYIDIVRNDRSVVYKKAKGMTFKSSAKKSKATKTEKIEVLNGEKVMYVINGNEEHIKKFKTYTRKSDSWDVMGHFRHYKSGLIKWIDGYKKGSGKTKPKHYKVK